MKKWLYILGIPVLLLLLLTWVYLLSSKSSDDNPIFNLFGFGDTTDESISLEDLIGFNDDTFVDVSEPSALRQLTINPTIGHREIPAENASSSAKVLYVEAGTGHVFSIDTVSGEEIRISNTTIPAARLAKISPDGSVIAIKSGDGAQSELYVIFPDADTTEDVAIRLIAVGVSDFSLTNSEVLYAVPGGQQTTVKKHDLATITDTILFTVPFSETVVLFGETADQNHYVYPKASAELQGFLYKYSNGVRSRLPVSGYGLSAVTSNEQFLFSKQNEGSYSSYSLINQQAINVLPTTLIPEKCVGFSTASELFICAIPKDLTNTTNLPDTWYRGDLVTNDRLWIIDTKQSGAGGLADLENLSAQQLDAIELQSNSEDNRLYFIDKNTLNLWVYDIPVTVNQE